jgi:signal peptidase I
MLSIFKVTGSSLSPSFLPGDYVLLVHPRYPFQRLSQDDVIVFEHPRFGRMIKKVTSINRELGTVKVEGTNPDSISSDQIGPVQISDVSGKVIFHFKKPPKI